MSNVWERFEGIVTADEVIAEKSKFEPLLAGEYDVVLEELAPAETQAGLPKLAGKFRTSTNRIIFYNQVLQNINNPQMTAVNVAKATQFVADLLGEEIEFKSLGQLADIVSSIPIGSKYKIEVSYSAKDIEMKYANLKVTENLNVPF